MNLKEVSLEECRAWALANPMVAYKTQEEPGDQPLWCRYNPMALGTNLFDKQLSFEFFCPHQNKWALDDMPWQNHRYLIPAEPWMPRTDWVDHEDMSELLVPGQHYQIWMSHHNRSKAPRILLNNSPMLVYPTAAPDIRLAKMVCEEYMLSLTAENEEQANS